MKRKRMLALLLILPLVLLLAAPTYAEGGYTSEELAPETVYAEESKEIADAVDTDTVVSDPNEDTDSSVSSPVAEENESSYVENADAVDDLEDSFSSDPDVVPSDESGLAAPEETSMQTESTDEELTGAGSTTYLAITWQDGYVQKIKLGERLTNTDMLNKAKSVLKDTLGLPGITYEKSLKVENGGVSASITSRDYFDGDSEVRVLAHMGYYQTSAGKKIATRDSLSSYRIARALGFHYVGGDVRFTKDNVPVVMHDPTINATARNKNGTNIGVPVMVREHTYSELLQYDIGLSTNAVYAGEKIPTLEQYLILCRDIGLIPNIHIKTDTGLTGENFESVANTVIATGMQGIATIAANNVSYLEPVIQIDPVSIVDLVVTDRWDAHYVLDAMSLRTGENQVEIGVIKELYTPGIATTCRFNNILLTTSANSEADAAKLDKYVSMISTDGALPNEIIRGARKRSYSGGNYVSNPEKMIDYQFSAHANTDLMIRMLSSMPNSKLRLDPQAPTLEVSLFCLEGAPDGYVNILCSRNWFALDVAGASTSNGAAIILANRNTKSESQMWKVKTNEDGSVTFVNRHSGKALAISTNQQAQGKYFTQYPDDGRSSTRFWVRKSAKQTNPKFRNSIVRFNSVDEKISISTKGMVSTEGANVEMVTKADNAAQKYRILYSGDGYYRIENVKSGLCLTVTGTGSTGNIIASKWANKSNQRWRISWNGNGSNVVYGTFRVQCARGNTAISIDGTIKAGTNVKANWWRVYKSQQWFIRKIK